MVKRRVQEFDTLNVVFPEVLSEVVVLSHAHSSQLAFVLPSVIVIIELVVSESGSVPEQLCDVEQFRMGQRDKEDENQNVLHSL